MAKKLCASCSDTFIGRAGAKYCSPACRQRARRAGGAAKCDKAVTDTGVASRGRRRRTGAAVGRSDSSFSGHCAEAVELLKRLDAELAENAKQLGKPLRWSASESAILELAADTIDRRSGLRQLYDESADDAKLRLKIACELRLIEAALARLLAKIKTDLPAPPSKTSRKATAAARARWDRNA